MTKGNCVTSSTVSDIDKLRDLGWSYTRIGAHYGVSERWAAKWHKGQEEMPEGLAPPATLNWGTALIVNDTQYPHFDKALWEVTCQVARDAEVDTLLWDGDILDFEQLGRYSHNPYRINQADADVAGFHRDLRDPILTEVPTIRRERFMSGNHEHRYNAYVDHNASAVGSFPGLREFIGLPDEVEFHEYGRARGTLLTPDLLVAHGWRAQRWSAYTAKNSLDDIGRQKSLIVGHTHRVGLHMQTTPWGPVACWEVGHMCDPENLPKSMQGEQDWAQVAGTLVRYERDGNAFDVKLNIVIGSKADRVLVGEREYQLER